MLYKEIEECFSEEVEKLAETNGSYIDSVIAICENHNIEPQVAAKIISQPIKEKIEAEGRDNNMLPKVSTLPI
tara:strand:+ start:726 stop:944 length:219 start_codon:yes stop_codon:yes gene_type:complete